MIVIIWKTREADSHHIKEVVVGPWSSNDEERAVEWAESQPKDEETFEGYQVYKVIQPDYFHLRDKLPRT